MQQTDDHAEQSRSASGDRQRSPQGPAPESSLTLAEAEPVAMRVLGFTGAMLHRSKTGWREEHPGEVAVFNASVVAAGVGQVWWGDFWFGRDYLLLRELADRLGGRVYLFLEADGPFRTERLLVGAAVAWVDPDGQVQLNERKVVWEDGQIRWVGRPRGRR